MSISITKPSRCPYLSKYSRRFGGKTKSFPTYDDPCSNSCLVSVYQYQVTTGIFFTAHLLSSYCRLLVNMMVKAERVRGGFPRFVVGSDQRRRLDRSVHCHDNDDDADNQLTGLPRPQSLILKRSCKVDDKMNLSNWHFSLGSSRMTRFLCIGGSLQVCACYCTLASSNDRLP